MAKAVNKDKENQEKNSREKDNKDKDNKDKDSRERLIDLLIHDLTGPLSVVSTSVANLIQKTERYGPLTDGQRRALERVLRNARKAQVLIHEIVEIYRSQEGLFQSNFFSVKQSLGESLIDVLDFTVPDAVDTVSGSKNPDELKQVLGSHGIELEVGGRYCESPFCHDERKVGQIFRNLMSNAMKYRRSRMKVCIMGDTDLTISVEDDGRGIPPDSQQAIFERFVRLQNQQSGSVPGLGLGLTGVKTLVEAMGGEITLDSREGEGTCFKVRIPPLEPPGFYSKRRNRKKESILDGKRILAVDDEPDLLGILEEEILEACPNCQVEKATNYEKAFEMLQDRTYEIVILDIMGVRGFELLELAVRRHFLVAMLTAHALSPEALKQSMELGARAYLPKEKLGEIVPFLEDVLRYEYLPGWKRLLRQLEDFFSIRWGAHWKRSEPDFWKEFEGKAEK